MTLCSRYPISIGRRGDYLVELVMYVILCDIELKLPPLLVA